MTLHSKKAVFGVLALVFSLTIALESSIAGSGCCPALAAKRPAEAVAGCSALASPKATALSGDMEQALLGAFKGQADLYIQSVIQNLRLMTLVDAVRSGVWDDMKDLMTAYQDGNPQLLVFYINTDGSYYTSKLGLTGKNLKDRSYFPLLMEGNEVVGEVVVGKTSGKKSTIVGVPVVEDGKVTGAVGAAVYLDDLLATLEKNMELPPNLIIFAMTPEDSLVLCTCQGAGQQASHCGGDKSKSACTKDGVKRCVAAGKRNAEALQTSDLTGWRFGIAGN